MCKGLLISLGLCSKCSFFNLMRRNEEEEDTVSGMGCVLESFYLHAALKEVCTVEGLKCSSEDHLWGPVNIQTHVEYTHLDSIIYNVQNKHITVL